MPSLKEHAKDPAIGAISQTNCERIADLLERRARRLRNPVLKWFCSDRKAAMDVELTAAVFSRVRGIPEPLPSQFDAQVMMAMEVAAAMGNGSD